MRIAAGIVVCLLIIGALTALTVKAFWAWMKHVARRVGLVEVEKADRRDRMMQKPAWLTKDEAEKWAEIERDYWDTYEGEDR